MTRRALAFVAAAILLAACHSARPRSQPTYTEDVAPILAENCAPCHQPSGTAPFSLLTHADAKEHAKELAEVTKTRFMPPWPPKRGLVKLASERGLTDSQIETIKRWVETGAPEGPAVSASRGSSRSSKTSPSATSDGWPLGPPDLILTMPEPFVLEADASRDVFRNFVLPVTISSSRWVRAVAVRPDNPRLVHHAVIQIDKTHSARYLDARDPEPGFGGMDMGHSEMPESQWLAWTPGKSFLGTPGIAWRLEARSDLVLQIHFRPSGKREPTKVSVGLYFTDRAPTEQPLVLWMGSLHIDIPAGEHDYVIEQSYVMPVDAEALAIFPHAHYLGRDLRIFATLPSGETRWLLHIEDWDFNWQDEYRYLEPIPLPKGTRLQIRYSYDNSPQNLANPSHPPERVVYGQESKNEMASCFLQIRPKNPADRLALARDHSAKMIAQNITDDLKMIAALPESSAPWNDLGDQYQSANRPQDAARAYEQALVLDPQLVRARNNLGLLLLGMGDMDRGISELSRAIATDERAAEVHANLGAALSAKGNAKGAIEHLSRALEIWPDYADAFYNRGLAHLRENDLERAAADLKKAIEIGPETAHSHNNLGMAFAMRGDIDDAIKEFQRATELDPGLREAQQNLAMAIRSRDARKEERTSPSR